MHNKDPIWLIALFPVFFAQTFLSWGLLQRQKYAGNHNLTTKSSKLCHHENQAEVISRILKVRFQIFVI